MCYDDVVLHRVAVVFVASLLTLVVGCEPCRRIERRVLDLDCSDASSFRDELHFDNEATYRSFLSDRCLPAGDPIDVEARVAEVDFSVDAVVVARGPRVNGTRCITARAVESVDVCTSGLRLIFEDVEGGVDGCPAGDWTVAVVVGRDDLRAAIGADEGVVTDDDVDQEI